MIDDIRLASEKREQAMTYDALKMLEHLQQSEIIRLVISGKYSPKDLDRAFRNMKKKIQKLENDHYSDAAEIMRLRRYIELLTRSEVEK